MNLVTPGARTTRGADFLGHILFGNRFDFLVGVAGVVHSAIAATLASLHRLVVVVMVMRMVVVMIVAVVMILHRIGGHLRRSFRCNGDRLNRFIVIQIDDIHASRTTGDGILTFHRLGPALRARAATARRTVLFLFLGAGHRPLFLDQRLTVSDRDLIVIRVDFGKGQKPMPVAAIFHKSRLKRGFNPRHFGKVDISG